MTTPEFPEQTFVALPTIGKFVVRIRKYNDPRTQTLESYTVTVGKYTRNPCVTISAPYDSDKPLKLAYVTSEVECTLDNITPLKGLATVQMIQLGITIARQLAPKSTTLTLEDCSHFSCSSPHGVKKMALPSFYIAFHGKTWYQDKFGAVLKDPQLRKQYEEGIANLDNPDYKPKKFNFTNNDIANELYELYDECKTWNEFFKEIEKKYTSKKCWVVQPWIEDAMRHVFGGLTYEMKEWVVDLSKVPILSFYTLDEVVPQLGGNWNNPYYERIMHRSSFYPFHLMNYKRFLRKTRSNKRRSFTRKNR